MLFQDIFPDRMNFYQTQTYFLKTDILCKLIENVNFTKFCSIFMAGLI